VGFLAKINKKKPDFHVKFSKTHKKYHFNIQQLTHFSKKNDNCVIFGKMVSQFSGRATRKAMTSLLFDASSSHLAKSRAAS